MKSKNKFKTTGLLHPVEELLTKSNYEIVEKFDKYAAPPYILVLLHNAMELILKDFLLSKNIDKITYGEGDKKKIKNVEELGLDKLIDFCKGKILLIRKNYQKFKAFNTDRNVVYHRSSLTVRIENIKDYYRLIVKLYNDVYQRRFRPSSPSRIKAYLILALYSFVFAYKPIVLVPPFNTIWTLTSVISFSAFAFFSITYFLKQYNLHKYFTFL